MADIGIHNVQRTTCRVRKLYNNRWYWEVCIEIFTECRLDGSKERETLNLYVNDEETADRIAKAFNSEVIVVESEAKNG